MRRRRLGRTHAQVSEIGHGLWGMSGWTGSEDAESLASMRLSAGMGCNFYDSAWAYGEGKSDGLLGQVVARNPSAGLFCASKVPPMNRKWPARAEYRYEDAFPGRHVVEHADKIRRQLGVDRIDLLQFHVWDDSWAGESDFRQTIERLKRDEVIRYFGLSLNRWEPANGIKALRTGLVDTVQVIYNIFDQAPEDELFPVCRALDIGVIARVPFDEGSLGGKMTRATRFPEDDWRANYFNPRNLASTMDRVEQLKKLLAVGMTLPQLALRFILSNPTVSTTVPGMRRPEHVRANLACSDAGPLPAELLQELKKHRWDRTPQAWSA